MNYHMFQRDAQQVAYNFVVNQTTAIESQVIQDPVPRGAVSGPRAGGHRDRQRVGEIDHLLSARTWLVARIGFTTPRSTCRWPN